jgi:hypothetical protein
MGVFSGVAKVCVCPLLFSVVVCPGTNFLIPAVDKKMAEDAGQFSATVELHEMKQTRHFIKQAAQMYISQKLNKKHQVWHLVQSPWLAIRSNTSKPGKR